jgi:hypothetical protein
MRLFLPDPLLLYKLVIAAMAVCGGFATIEIEFFC